MQAPHKKNLILFLVFGLIAVISAAIPEMGGEYFSSYDGLGRAVYLTLLVTVPAAILSLLFLVKLVWGLYRSRR